MKSLFTLLMFVVASHCLHARITPNDDSNFNVLKYGATGDGNTDDSDVYIILTYHFIVFSWYYLAYTSYLFYDTIFFMLMDFWNLTPI